MSTKLYLFISGLFFFVIGTLHLLRLVLQIPVLVGEWQFPIWMSLGGFMVPMLLSFLAFRLYKRV